MVVLSPEQTTYAWKIGKTRNGNNQANHVPEKKLTRRDSSEIHAQGVMGEMALFIMLGLPYESTLRDTRGRSARTERTHDMLLQSGETVDVKTTLVPNGFMRVPTWKRYNPASYYVHFEVLGGVMPGAGMIAKLLFRGAIHHTGVFTPNRPIQHQGDVYIVGVDELAPFCYYRSTRPVELSTVAVNTSTGMTVEVGDGTCMAPLQ